MQTGLRARMGKTTALNRENRKVRATLAKRGCAKYIATLAQRSPALWLKAVFFLFTWLTLGPVTFAQSAKGTVRHHTVEEQDPSAALLTEAESEINKQDYVHAEALLKKYLEAHPESYSAWYDLGFVSHALGKKEDAVSAYRKSVAAKPDVFESNLNLGLALAQAGQPDAEEYLRAATNLKPSGDAAEGHKRAWMGLGHVMESTKPDEAISAFQQAAALDSKDPEPRLAAGSLFESQQQLPNAEKEYRAAVTIDPNNADALTALTNLYMQQKRFPEAQDLLRKIIAAQPGNAGAHLQLGRMLAIAGKNEEAVSEMQAGLKLDPTDQKAQRDLANVYLDMGKAPEAQQLYISLLAAHPDDAELHHGLGTVLIREKKFAEAQQELLKAVQLRPDFGEAYGDLSVAANQNKDYALAIKAVDARAKYLPETPITFFLRATAYDHLRDSKQAAKYYHQFLDTAGGKYPDQEWQARHRLVAIEQNR